MKQHVRLDLASETVLVFGFLVIRCQAVTSDKNQHEYADEKHAGNNQHKNIPTSFAANLLASD